MSAVRPLLPACIDTHPPLHTECLAFSLSRASSMNGCLCPIKRNSRPPVYLLDSSRNGIWPNDLLRNRRAPGRMISVSCSQGSGNGQEEPLSPQDGSKLHNRDSGANCGEDAAFRGHRESLMWDLEAYCKQWQEVAARLGDPLREFFSSVRRAMQNHLDSYRGFQAAADTCKEVTEESCTQKVEWDWERWREHFTEVEEQENLVSVLKFQLEDAISAEDFQEAGRLKKTLQAANASDPVAEILTELKKALAEERYEEATRLRDDAAAGLVGWWVGLAEGENDPYGRIINISPAHGRFIARGYTARQLASASTGAPLFEVFLRRDPEEGYQQQVVYLQRDTGMGESIPGATKSLGVNIDLNVVDMKSLTEDGKEIKAKDLSEALGEEKGKIEDAAVMDEGLNRIIDFLKERIPDVKLKVFRVIAQNGEDLPKIVEHILDDVATQKGDEDKISQENTGAADDVLQEMKDKVSSGDVSQVNQKEIPVRLIVGGMLQNASEERLPRAPIRVPARIEYRSRDSFLFHIEETTAQQGLGQEFSSAVKVATISKSTSAGSGASDADKNVWNLEKLPVKVSKDMAEFLKVAVSQVQKRRGLSRCTSFNRIKLMDSSNDVLTGVFIGAFGPYSTELVQLKRKFGYWHGDDDLNKDKLDFFEYVEAIKLTGDLNVPAGQVTFRAKVGKENRLPHRGVYPEELGVTARYKGQGRLADAGFKNPKWVDGELVVLDGKGIGHASGAELGFVYSIPDRHFLVLFNRLKLQA